MKVLHGTDDLGKIKWGKVGLAIFTGGLSLIPIAKGGSVQQQSGQSPTQVATAAAVGNAIQTCLLQRVGPLHFQITGKLIDQDKTTYQSYAQQLQNGVSCEALVSALEQQLRVKTGGGVSQAAQQAVVAAAQAMQQDYGRAMTQAAATLMEAGIGFEERSRIIQAGGETLRLALEQAQDVIDTNRRAREVRKTVMVVGGLAAVAGIGYLGFRLLRR